MHVLGWIGMPICKQRLFRKKTFWQDSIIFFAILHLFEILTLLKPMETIFKFIGYGLWYPISARKLLENYGLL